MTRLQHFERFFVETSRRDVTQQWRKLLNRRRGIFFDIKIEFDRKTYRAQHAYRIFTITRFRIANQAHQTIFQIFHAAGIVVDAVVCNVVIHGIDGEIAALGIFINRAVHVIT
ncbi:Uncharacterised protein [Vibrio cholerae]|uniref:Uncharacterized protein n=1 Tax=Vibrio cholerae TaxID=666 RepID=A0A655VRX0_VIBCL|nr:Uncharacterised protein [Vibrio cholerae]CSA11311.1 Uncharacterised protein [Vibrio cholerae]CSA38715.1 Uncharacterised protein [Vibrio cholerae]CSA46099.1 Uncharacterised protein [Vibrio cholerae]CSB28505.1 Uncharacterised protein [Vibrio cholerae]